MMHATCYVICDNMKKFLEGSKAVAEAVKMCKPAVVSAYPITPQTHIVEHLAQFKADAKADFEFINTESEFAAASVVFGASARGVRAYTATSSQGLLLMAEVLFNIAGMRLPIVLTCANRAVSAPINIWNDQQDSLTVRDAGWIMLYAEHNQDAVDMHIQAFKIAEKLNIPVMVNMDGFVLTHTFEDVEMPDQRLVNKYLPARKVKKGEYLDPDFPMTMGLVAGPKFYMEIRQEFQQKVLESAKLIKQEYQIFNKLFNRPSFAKASEGKGDGMVEYYGSGKEPVVIVTFGSVIGTIKDLVEKKYRGKVGILKIRCFRPFPKDEIVKALSKAEYIAVVEKDISLGSEGILATEIKSAAFGRLNSKIQSFVVGLGGRDVTYNMIEKIIAEVRKKEDGLKFVGK